MRRFLKWTGILGGTVLTLVILVVVFQVMRFGREANRSYDVAPLSITAGTDSALVARGARLATAIGCTGCHGAQLEGLAGEDLGPIGVMNAPNLTTGEGGVGGDYSDGELARVIRHGIKNDGTSVLFMPSNEYTWLPDTDLTALVSYMRSIPPVDNTPPPLTVGLLGKLLNQFGVFDLTVARGIDHTAPPADVPDPEPTARYGYFLARGCAGCHGENMSGGKIPGAPSSLPIPANLTPHETGLAGWSLDQFVSTLQTGVRPDGRELDPFMPVEPFGAMNSVELEALYRYFMSLPALEKGTT